MVTGTPVVSCGRRTLSRRTWLEQDWKVISWRACSGVQLHSESGAEPLKIRGGKRPSLTFRKTAGWREIGDISFWKQRDQYCSYSGQLRLRQWE